MEEYEEIDRDSSMSPVIEVCEEIEENSADGEGESQHRASSRDGERIEQKEEEKEDKGDKKGSNVVIDRVDKEVKVSPIKNINSNTSDNEINESENKDKISEDNDKAQTNKARIRTVSFDDVNNNSALQNCLKTPIHNREIQHRCSTPPTVSPSKSRFLSANQMESKAIVNPFYNLLDKMNKASEDMNIEDSNMNSNDLMGSKLYKQLIEFNEELVEKTQDLISIRMQLQTLENNINAQVDEFLKSLSISHTNIQTKFLEIQRNNEELRKIKDFILEANLQSNTFTYKKILETLNLKSIDEIDKIENFRKQDKSKSNSEVQSQSINEKNENEESKELNPRTSIHSLIKVDKPKISNDFDKPEIVKNPFSKDIVNQMNDFEDDDFKFNINKIGQSKKKEGFSVPDKKRTVSSSAIEEKLTPSFCGSQAVLPESFKRFKLNETSTIDSSRVNPFFPNLNAPSQLPPFPFMPNLQVDSDLVCQMLIRKLAANGGLNDICRILPDTFLNRTRSNTE